MLLEHAAMRRPLSKHLGQRDQIERVAYFECGFAYAVLLRVVSAAQADGPAVGGLERAAAVGTRANVGALDRAGETTGDRTAMPPDPGAVRRTRARGIGAPLADEAGREVHASHARALLVLEQGSPRASPESALQGEQAWSHHDLPRCLH